MQAFLAQMLADNGGCELPCWWGITPGETSWEETIRVFTEQGIRVSEAGQLGLEYPSGQYRERTLYADMLDVVFHEQNGVVQSVLVENDDYYLPLRDDFAALWGRYALQPVLSRHGPPSQVHLNLNVGAGCVGSGLFPDYVMWVIYQDQGIAIRYSGMLISDHEKYLVCPVFGQVGQIQLRLQSPGADAELVDPSSEVYDLGGTFSIYGTAADLAGMSEQEFYEAFSDPVPQACISIPDPGPAEGETILVSDVPPLPSSAEDELLVDLLANNAGCELPCWWGIMPGETTPDEAHQVFLSHGKSISIWGWEEEPWGTPHMVSLFGSRGEYPFDYVLEHIYYDIEGVVSLIGALGHVPGWPADEWSIYQGFVQDWDRYSLDQVLTRMGEPSQVLLHYWVEFELPYSIGLLYEEQGILFEYMGVTYGEIPEGGYRFDPALICAGRDQFTDINVWLRPVGLPPDEAALADVFLNFGGGHLDLVPYNVAPTLEEATGLDVSQFYDLFVDPGADLCLEARGELGDWVP
jgi:hypothetical protein